MLLSDLVSRVRQEIGDPLQTFSWDQPGDGTVSWFNLPNSNISSTGFVVREVVGVQVNTLVLNTDYTMNFELGELTLTVNLPNAALLLVSGSAYSMFSDADLQVHIADGVRWHTYNQSTDERYQNREGWITYRQIVKNLDNLPRIEEPLLIMRCALNALWNLANDIASDMNIQTAEGTNIDHGELYGRLMAQINALSDRYQLDAAMLNVGPYRMETLTLRRVSQTTGRLVPVFKPREFDDHRYPTRELPPIDSRDEDSSGVPSQLWGGGPL